MEITTHEQTSIQEARTKFVGIMDTLKQKNKEALEQGNNRLGYEIGGSNTLEPVFILAKPVESIEPHKWQTDDGQKEAFNLIRRYVCISPEGAIAVRFNKRLVDANGQRSEYHSGPGGVKELDNDDVEGGENGTFLRLLEMKAGTSESGFNSLGLARSVDDNKLVLILGDSFKEQGVYKENEPERSFWGIDAKVDDNMLKTAITTNLENSKQKAPPTKDQTEVERLSNQASILEKIINS